MEEEEEKEVVVEEAVVAERLLLFSELSILNLVSAGCTRPFGATELLLLPFGVVVILFVLDVLLLDSEELVLPLFCFSYFISPVTLIVMPAADSVLLGVRLPLAVLAASATVLVRARRRASITSGITASMSDSGSANRSLPSYIQNLNFSFCW